MTKQTTVRFLKLDKFNNAVFIAGNDDSKETDAYNQLLRYNTKLGKKYPASYLPTYHSTNEYVSIKFSPCKWSFSPGSYYTIDYKFTTRQNGDKTYVNAHILKSKLFLKVESDDVDIELNSDSD